MISSLRNSSRRRRPDLAYRPRAVGVDAVGGKRYIIEGITLEAMPRRHAHLPAFSAAPEEAGGARVAGRIWVERGERTYLAWGRVVLLERIGEHGSISAAARSMGMGYRHAWDLVDAMNRLAPAPLVERSTGGRGGGGTRVTPAGERAIAQFWETVRAFERFLQTLDPPGLNIDDDAGQEEADGDAA